MWQVSRKPAVGKVAAGLWQWQLGVGQDPVSILEESLWLHCGGGGRHPELLGVLANRKSSQRPF